MTRDQAAQIIADALKSYFAPPPTDFNQSGYERDLVSQNEIDATKIATALDALGFLSYAVDQVREAANTSQPDFIRATPEGHRAWAEQRKRP